MTLSALKQKYAELSSEAVEHDDLIAPIVHDFDIFIYCQLVSESEEGQAKRFFDRLKKTDPKLYSKAMTGKMKYLEYLAKKYPFDSEEE